jgi:heme A synthase
MTRALIISLHLVNSFLLLASLNIAVRYKTLIVKPKKLAFAELCLVLLFLIVSSFGAVTALGDTLFPSTSLIEGINKDFAPGAHILLSLRVYHPILAVALSFFLIRYALSRSEVLEVKTLSTFLIISVVFQVCLGILTILMLAPAYMQIIHLFGSIIVWHFLVRLVTFPSYPAS